MSGAAAAEHRPSVSILDGAAAIGRALADVVQMLAEDTSCLVSLATGRTFAPFFAELASRVARRRLSLRALTLTHLDEYLGFATDQRGGMVHELTTACPPLLEMLNEGRLWPVPSSGEPAALREHERWHEREGVHLQLLGIGRNGHLAFNEPGCDPDLGFHRVRLDESTRRDAASRFWPDPVPVEAVTAGLRTILRASELWVVATGEAKAPAVRAMLQGPIGPQCPASYVRRHRHVRVLLDRAAAAGLGGE